MNLQELENKKNELIERVSNWSVYGEEGEAQKQLILKLIKGTDTNDVDFSQALEDGTAESIIQLDLDCYDLTDFIVWLSKHNFDLFIDYRFANTITIKEVLRTLEENQEDEPQYLYDFDFDEYNQLNDEDDKIEYIKDHFDGLLCSDKVLVISW